MGDVFEGVSVIIFVIIFFIGFTLFIQLMSKISGKNIKQKYGGTIARPDDFDTSIELIKNTSEELNFRLKTLGLSKFKKIMLRFEKVLANPSNFKYSDYSEKVNKYLKLKEEYDREYSTERYNSDGNRSLRIYSTESASKQMKKELELNMIGYEIHNYERHFTSDDILKIINFIGPTLNNDDKKIILFIDKLGCENIKTFNGLIGELEKSFLKNEITSQEINNIKKFILISKGVLKNII